MDGWITIGTKLDTNEFDKDVSNLETKIKKEEEKSELKLKAKLQAQRELDEHKQKIFEIEQEYEKLAQRVEHVQGIMEKQGKGLALTPQDFTDMQNYNELNTQYEKMGSQLDKMYGKQEQLNMKVAKASVAYQDVNDRVSEYKQKIDSINLQRQQQEISRFKEGFSSVGNSIQGAIQKVTKLALGVFGIRSAFMAVRRASSELATYNPQYAANLEYIRYALTQMIAPVLEYILNLAKTILAYINYIANAWFGVNLFANASAKSFNKVKKNIGGASSAAKELQKTLAGFDEMNILNSNSTGGGGGVGGGAIGPDFDLADLSNVEIPDWIKWIANNKDLIIGAIKGIATAFLIFKALKITGILGSVSTAIKNLISSLGFFRGALVTLGIVAIIAGIATAIKGVIDFIKDPSWSNFRTILVGLEIAAAGLAAVLIGLNASNPLGWIILAVDAVAAIATGIASLIIQENKEMTTEEKLRQSVENLTNARKNLTDETQNYVNAVDNAENAERKLQEAQDNTGISIDDLLIKMEEENLTYKDLNEAERQVYKAYIDNKNAQEQLTESTAKMMGYQQAEEDSLYQVIAALKEGSKNHDEYKKGVMNAYETGKISAKDAAKAISISLAEMDETTRQQFTQDLPNEIKEGLDPNNYQTEANKFSNWWNEDFFGGLTKRIKLLIEANTSGKLASGSYKMASGGIVNMPSRGVPVTSAVAGEAGRERNNSFDRPTSNE